MPCWFKGLEAKPTLPLWIDFAPEKPNALRGSPDRGFPLRSTNFSIPLITGGFPAYEPQARPTVWYARGGDLQHSTRKYLALMGTSVPRPSLELANRFPQKYSQVWDLPIILRQRRRGVASVTKASSGNMNGKLPSRACGRTEPDLLRRCSAPGMARESRALTYAREPSPRTMSYRSMTAATPTVS